MCFLRTEEFFISQEYGTEFVCTAMLTSINSFILVIFHLSKYQFLDCTLYIVSINVMQADLFKMSFTLKLLYMSVFFQLYT